MWIQILIQSAFAFLASILPQLIAKILTTMGISIVTYSISSFGVDWIFDRLKSATSGVPAQGLQWLAYMNFDDCIGIVLGALAASYALSGINNGKTTKIKLKS